jgi:hypothetical protein
MIQSQFPRNGLLIMSTEKKTKSTLPSAPRLCSLASQQRQKVYDVVYECLDPLPKELIDLLISYFTFAPRFRQDWKENEMPSKGGFEPSSVIQVYNEYCFCTPKEETFSPYLIRTGPRSMTWRMSDCIMQSISATSTLYVDELRGHLAVTTWDDGVNVFSLKYDQPGFACLGLAVDNFAQFPYTVICKTNLFQFQNAITRAKIEFESDLANDAYSICCTDKFCAFKFFHHEVGIKVDIGCFATGKVAALDLDTVANCVLSMSERYLVLYPAYTYLKSVLAVYRLDNLSCCWLIREDLPQFECILDDRVIVTSTNGGKEFQCRDIESGEILSSVDLSHVKGQVRIQGHFLRVDGEDPSKIYSIFDLGYFK